MFKRRTTLQGIGLLMVYFFALVSFSQKTVGAEPRTLRVGLTNSPPFVMISDHKFTGIIIDLWSYISKELHLPYQFVIMGTNLDDNIKALADGNIDLLLGPVAINYSRAMKVSFTRPYAINKTGIVISQVKTSLFRVFFNLFMHVFSWTVLLAILVVVIYAHAFWYLERGKENSIPMVYPQGVIRIFWACLLRADGSLRATSTSGKCFQFFWMSFNAIIFSILYAAMVTTFHLYFGDVSNFHSLEDFKGKKIIAIEGSISFVSAENAGIRVTPVKNRELAMKKLLAGKADGFVDSTALALVYMQEHQLTEQLMFAPYVVKVNLIAFALPKGSSLAQPFNRLLALLDENGTIKRVCQYYFKNEASTYCF